MSVQLINMDCMDFMKDCADNSFDLAIVDPEYGIGVNSMNMGSRKTIRPDKRTWDNKPPSDEYFNELFRVSENQIIWGGNYFKQCWPTRCFIVWDKGETLYGRSFAECELAYTSFDKSARMFKKNPNQKDRIHVTQKPVALYKWLLHNYAKPGQSILDTHLGSGSSAIAAHYFGCDFTGIEIDKEYFDAAEARFKKATRQIALF